MVWTEIENWLMHTLWGDLVKTIVFTGILYLLGRVGAKYNKNLRLFLLYDKEGRVSIVEEIVQSNNALFFWSLTASTSAFMVLFAFLSLIFYFITDNVQENRIKLLITIVIMLNMFIMFMIIILTIARGLLRRLRLEQENNK